MLNRIFVETVRLLNLFFSKTCWQRPNGWQDSGEKHFNIKKASIS